MTDWKDLLLNYDYYYSYSDDHSVWRKGEAAREQLQRINKESSLYHKELYSTAMNYHQGEINREEFDQEFLRISMCYAMDDLIQSINGGL